MRCREALLVSLLALTQGCGGGSGGSSETGDGAPPGDATSTDSSTGSDANGDVAPGPDGAIPDATTDATTDGSADATTEASPEQDASMPDSMPEGSADSGGPIDSSLAPDSSNAADSGTAADSSSGADSGTGTDSGEVADSAATSDSGSSPPDASDAPVAIVSYAPGVTVSTLAGNGSYGDTDGQDASFSNPTGIALYGAGGLIVVENDTGAIRTVSATGYTQTVGMSPVDVAQTSPFTIVGAPGGYYYSTDFDQNGAHVDGGGGVWSFVLDDAGQGSSALVAGGMDLPRTLVPLPSGNVFVFDDSVQGWAPATVEVAQLLAPGTGTLTFLAGDRGHTGFANGDGGAALFGSPTVGGVLLPDGSGVVLADCGNSQLRLVTLDGTVSTFSGSTTAGWVDGPKGSALFSCPHALAIDPAGNIYVSDWNNNAIRRVAVDGSVVTIAGNGVSGYADGPGNAAEFYGAEGMIVSADGTTLYVADGTQGNGAVPYNRIRAITLPSPDGG
jgi:sugar lactone lactonase YvrE